MEIVLNGQSRTVNLEHNLPTVSTLVQSLDMKPDRIAVEHNGVIVRRDVWDATRVQDGDRFEIVQFVGGGW